MKSVRLVLYFNRVFDLYELMNVKYLPFHMELQKRGMAIQFEEATQKFCSIFLLRGQYLVRTPRIFRFVLRIFDQRTSVV